MALGQRDERNPRSLLTVTPPPRPADSDRRASKRCLRTHVALAVAFAAAGAHGQQPAALEPVVVTGNRVETQVFEAPYAIGVVGAGELRSGGLMVNLSEALVRVPGLVINNRSNYAQDLQISSRGFGARASFGVRGLRLYTDGIPASTPDGAGQVTHFDLAGAERIEVLRGPFSALYGNSSGGVIALFSAPAAVPRAELAVDAASFGQRQVRAGVGGPIGDRWNAQLQAAHFEVDGFRPHSAAERDLVNFRLGHAGPNDDITLLVSGIDQPADDPLGLTREQFDADAFQTTPQAIDFNTRKVAKQEQVGLNWRHRFGDGALSASELTVYAGERSVTQWQAIPVATQAPPRHPGGVIDFDRSYYGLDARLIWRFGTRASLVTGVNVEMQDEDRRGFENFIGSPPDQQLGVTGALRRDENNKVRSNDVYAQGEVDLFPSVAATLGVRSGRIRFEARDAFLANGDDSGSREFSYTNPVLGVRWRVMPGLNLYASAGRGFESPNLNELAYRPDGTSGFNAALQPQTSRQVEIGAKWRALDNRLALDVAVFNAKTDDEIGVLTNAGGRSSFQNVGRTERHGAEASLRWQLMPTLRTTVAATLLDATYTDGFLTCGPPPCTTPTVPVAAGNRIAGTNRSSGFAELAWQPKERTELAAELRAQAKTPVNDINSDFAGSFTTLGLRAQQRYVVAQGTTLDLSRASTTSPIERMPAA